MTNGRAGGWIRGLIHLHSRYSDGKSTVRGLSELARDAYGYEYLIFTDHAECLDRESFARYAEECRDVSGPDFVVIPGLEIATVWSGGSQDRSQAHTVAFSRDPWALQRLLPLKPSRNILSSWMPQPGAPPATRRLRERLAEIGSVSAAAHQFSYSKAAAGHCLTFGPFDYRYDLANLRPDDGVDFYYGNLIEVDHEAEDMALYSGMQARWAAAQQGGEATDPPWAYTGSDYHFSLWQSRVAKYRFVPRSGLPALPVSILSRWNPARELIEWADRWLSPGYEQLRRVTWLGLDDDLSTEAVIEALKRRRTCATRGRTNTINWLNITPMPGTREEGPVRAKTPEISLYLQFERPTTRPLFSALFRDGVEISGFSQTFGEGKTSLWLNWKDEQAASGVHSYVAVVSGKLVTSPILIDKT